MNVPDEIVEHMRRHSAWAEPSEACGLLAGDGISLRFFYACTNAFNSSRRFRVDHVEQFRAMEHAADMGWTVCGSFHSHPDGVAAPSPTDIDGALDPTWWYFIGAGSDLAGFRIRQRIVEQVFSSH